MIAQILARTPAWVFALFLGLLAFGLMQTRTRTVPRVPALLLPAGMIALSLAGIQTSFGLAPLPLASWAIALALAALVGHALFRDERVRYDANAKTYFVPGSWVPLAVIMAIFFAKYVYAVMNALNAAVLSATSFVIGLSAVYGLLSGYFAAKALNLVRLTRAA
ncbi:MAG: tat pathway signal sequence [Rubrivivax sp.]|nr:tat pathway signal sequence [Rubrivivax sp.]